MRSQKLFVLFIIIVFNIGFIPIKAENTTSFKLESSSNTILKGTILTLIVEKGVDASLDNVGDLFTARVAESVYTEDQKEILIPKGSWVNGRVIKVQSPSRLSKAGKLFLELDYLTTLSGNLLPINATISFEGGKVNQEGVLDPQTGFKNKALAPTKKLLSTDTGQIVTVATLGLPVFITLLSGSTKAIISKGDNIGLAKGEFLKIELKDDNLILKE
jgi:hypothetical protein